MDEVSLKSEAMSFSVLPYGVPSGEVTAIRVQDIKEDKWFNWDNGKWDAEPVVTPGAGNLYIAFWVTNIGETGDLTLNIKDAKGVLATKTFTVPAGGGLGVEWTGDMPNSNYALTVESDPGDSVRFTVKPSGWVPPLPWWQIALIAVAVIGSGAGIYALGRRGKG